MDLNKITDRDEALNILGLDNDYTQLDLIETYRTLVQKNQSKMEYNEGNENFSIVANELYNCSMAYLVLRDKEMIYENAEIIPPLLIFTDASVYYNSDHAAFAIVAEVSPQVKRSLISRPFIETRGNVLGLSS